MRASGSVVEHLLAKEGVAGSIPVSRFYFFKRYPMDTSFVIRRLNQLLNEKDKEISFLKKAAAFFAKEID